MKNLFTVFVLVIALSANVLAKENEDIIAEVIPNSDKMPIEKILREEFRLTESLIQIWESEDWQDESKTLYTYNEAGFLIETITQEYIGGEWIN